MSTYVFYDRASGEILHIHREYFLDSEQTATLSEADLRSQLAGCLPNGRDIGVIGVREPLRPPRGYRAKVDLATLQIIQQKINPGENRR